MMVNLIQSTARVLKYQLGTCSFIQTLIYDPENKVHKEKSVYSEKQNY